MLQILVVYTTNLNYICTRNENDRARDTARIIYQ